MGIWLVYFYHFSSEIFDNVGNIVISIGRLEKWLGDENGHQNCMN
jgi:hypothetical protein